MRHSESDCNARRPWRRPGRRAVLCALIGAALVSQFVIRAELSLRQKSAVWDEQLHLGYGLDFIAQGPGFDGRDHPYPVAALLAAAVFDSSAGPASGRELRVERAGHLFPARRVNVALAAVALLVLAVLAARRFGAAAALLVLGLGALDPGWIAQARFVTTDTALGIAFALAAFALARHRETRELTPLIAAGLALGFGMTAKLSAVLIAAAVPLLFLVPAPGQAFREGLLKRLGWSVAAGGIVLGIGLACYLLVIEGAALWHGLGLADGWNHVIQGLEQAIAKRAEPRGVFLLGSFHSRSSVLYFPVLLLAKTPLVLLVLLGIAAALRESRALISRQRILLLLPALYLLVAILSRVNMGFRHLTPVLPALWIIGGFGALALWRHTPRGRIYAGVLLLALTIEGLALHPHYLPATNILFGGVDGAHRVAVDSATDWGQDLPALKEYLARHPPQQGPAHLAFFGNADPRAYVGRTVWRPCGGLGFPPRRGQARAGCRAGAEVLAISATCLMGATGRRVGRRWSLTQRNRCYAWLRGREPDAILGGSILVFRNLKPSVLSPRSR
ncbi:MAG: glycosyltransferase family 39 protein [bacterium]